MCVVCSEEVLILVCTPLLKLTAYPKDRPSAKVMHCPAGEEGIVIVLAWATQKARAEKGFWCR